MGPKSKFWTSLLALALPRGAIWDPTTKVCPGKHQFVYHFCLQKFVYIGNVNIGRSLVWAPFRHPTWDIVSEIGGAVTTGKLEPKLDFFWALGQPATGGVFAPKRPLGRDGKALQACIYKLPMLGFTGGMFIFCFVPWTSPCPQGGGSLVKSNKALASHVYCIYHHAFLPLFGHFSREF